jgi:hypothetical protein
MICKRLVGPSPTTQSHSKSHYILSPWPTLTILLPPSWVAYKALVPDDKCRDYGRMTSKLVFGDTILILFN